MKSDKLGGMVELDEVECLQLLNSRRVGRLGLNTQPSPLVLPVNYTVYDESIYFYTSRGSKKKAASSRYMATFQVDEYDPGTHSGWSVMARGMLEIMDPEDKPVQLPKPLPEASHPYLVRMLIEEITGRKKTGRERAWVLPTYTWALMDQEAYGDEGLDE